MFCSYWIPAFGYGFEALPLFCLKKIYGGGGEPQENLDQKLIEIFGK